MQIDLSKSELLLLRCLSPRKNDDDLASTAKTLLVTAMRSEASRRRIGTDRIGVTALIEAVERRRSEP